MENFILLITCLLLGIGLRRLPGFPRDAAKGINAFIIYLSLPAITLRYIPELTLGWELAFPIGMSWIVFLVAIPLFTAFGRWWKLDKRTVGAMVLVCGLGNTSFVGFPLIRYFYGEAGLKIAILCDQPGAFLVLSTLGIAAVGYYGSGSFSWRQIGRRVLSFPPFVAFVLALALSWWTFPGWLNFTLDSLGSTLTPLALVSVGLQLQLPTRRFPYPALAAGLVYKLLLAPALIAALYLGLFRQSGLAIDVSILEAAMAPMITPAIICMDHDLNPPLASIFVGLGIPLSLLTVYGWFLWV